MMLNRKKVMIVDPSPIYRRKLKAVIQTNETLVDVTEAATINAAEDILRNQELDVVFFDTGFPEADGIRLIGLIQGMARDVRLVVLTSLDSAAYQAAALENGAAYFLPKEHAVGLRLIDVIHETIRRQ
jgi:two-component system, NarL family, invasion response regulator UvrY